MPIRILIMFLVPCIFFSMDSFSADVTPKMEHASAAVYTSLVDDIVSSCSFKCTLSNSRSEHLQQCAHEAFIRGRFIRANKDQLIEQMQKSSIKPKKYTVKLFVYEAYRNSLQSKN